MDIGDLICFQVQSSSGRDREEIYSQMPLQSNFSLFYIVAIYTVVRSQGQVTDFALVNAM